MGLNKPITVGGGLTAAEVQAIIDAQTTAISGKVDAQTNTLKTDIPSSISGGASISDINAALDEKLPQYASGSVVKSRQFVYAPSLSRSLVSGCVGNGMVISLDTSKSNYYVLTLNNTYTRDEINAMLDDYFGFIVLSPVDKSHSLICSSRLDFLDNRDYNSGLIQRRYNYSVSVNEVILYDSYDESIMCLEFN